MTLNPRTYLLAASALAAAVAFHPASARAATAQSVSAFLDSVGIDTTFPDRGQPLDKTITMIKFGGWRWVRAGIEGLSDNGLTTMQTFLDLHQATGVKFDWGMVSGSSDLKRLLATSHILAKADALLAFEGNNEPNNWGVTYQGEQGGGHAKSWLAVAKLQRDFYAGVKADPELAKYPVWSISENGAQSDNVGLQFLTIPPGAGTLMPAGTIYADCANVHNYIYHNHSPNVADNKTWNASDPGPACNVDGLFGNYGVTWANHFHGYTVEQLKTLPRVTTETGCTIDNQVTEEIHADNLVSMYLDQFTRGWNHTSVYILRDRTDESGNQSFGFFNVDYTPRKAATYLHNLTTILADTGTPTTLATLNYSIPNQPHTVHDLLLQKSDGTLELIVWNERVHGSNDVTITLGDQPVNVKQYDIEAGTTATDTQTAVKTIKVTLSNHPVILEITAK